MSSPLNAYKLTLRGFDAELAKDLKKHTLDTGQTVTEIAEPLIRAFLASQPRKTSPRRRQTAQAL